MIFVDLVLSGKVETFFFANFRNIARFCFTNARKSSIFSPKHIPIFRAETICNLRKMFTSYSIPSSEKYNDLVVKIDRNDQKSVLISVHRNRNYDRDRYSCYVSQSNTLPLNNNNEEFTVSLCTLKTVEGSFDKIPEPFITESFSMKPLSWSKSDKQITTKGGTFQFKYRVPQDLKAYVKEVIVNVKSSELFQKMDIENELETVQAKIKLHETEIVQFKQYEKALQERLNSISK